MIRSSSKCSYLDRVPCVTWWLNYPCNYHVSIRIHLSKFFDSNHKQVHKLWCKLCHNYLKQQVNYNWTSIRYLLNISFTFGWLGFLVIMEFVRSKSLISITYTIWYSTRYSSLVNLVSQILHWKSLFMPFWLQFPSEFVHIWIIYSMYEVVFNVHTPTSSLV